MLESAVGATVADASAALQRRYGIDAERADADARRFLIELNRKLLVNVGPRGGERVILRRWIGDSLKGVTLLVMPRLSDIPRRREALRTTGPVPVVLGVARAMLPRTAVIGLAAGLVLWLLMAGIGISSLEGPLTVSLGFVIGLVAHEAGHALALIGRPAWLAMSGPRFFVLHGRQSELRMRLAAAGGPALTTAAGWALLSIAAATSLDWLALCSTLLTFHGLGLTVLGLDGRNLACGRF